MLNKKRFYSADVMFYAINNKQEAIMNLLDYYIANSKCVITILW